MIVFLESDKNNFTTYLNPPIQAHRVRLISCSLYNSWYNLIGAKVRTLSNSALVEESIPDGYYTPITLAKELKKHQYTLTTGLPHEMTIKRDWTTNTNWTVPVGNFGQLLGIEGKAITGTAIPVKWKVPSSYEVYCDLVHSYQEGPSHLMSKFPPKGNPFDLVEYTPISLNYDLSCGLVSEISISIKVDGETVDFNGRKINLILEFI